TDSGSGYYLLNRKKLLNGKYVGSDCSGLVSTAIWGTKNVHSSDRTIEIATSKSYKTVKSFKKMRPGDLICRQYSHVVMFLYYVNPEKTKIMVIENGGAEAGTNTVHCAVHDVSYYTKRAYKVRRLSWLG
ncbi:MAG: long-chain fatty acid--CoA ligase, partial [Clostridiales bacterium]|nr:long-chain fatty acid--CoA ligase [Clostridiales bacterium]